MIISAEQFHTHGEVWGMNQSIKWKRRKDGKECR
jgi:hypothetical protein